MISYKGVIYMNDADSKKRDTAEKIFNILKNENFGNESQRGKLVSLLARLKSMPNDSEISKLFREIGKFFTTYFSSGDTVSESQMDAIIDETNQLLKEKIKMAEKDMKDEKNKEKEGSVEDKVEDKSEMEKEKKESFKTVKRERYQSIYS